MSGIFRSTSLNNTSHSTPQKRYSYGAFCTSPSTLKDVTMEHPYGVGFPCVSLQGQGATSPPVQGRSVREFEEQMASLRKENFNLKLRLYFLEESVPGYHQANTEGHESLMKQLIDTKVEIEILRKELEEKQELLKEAAQAMNHMEEIQKETEAKAQAFIEELKQKIQFLEMEREMDKSQESGFMNEMLGRSEISENVNTLQKIRELEGMVTQSEEKICALQTQNSKYVDGITKLDEAMKEYEDKVKELAFQNAELQEMMENKEKDMANVEYQLKEKKLELADKLCELDDVQQELHKLRKGYDTACRTLQQLLQREKSEQKVNTVCGGNNRAVSDSEAFQNPTRKCDHESTIQKLEAEVKKKTAALQDLINNELWQKNREIERLTKLVNSHTTSPLSPTAGRKHVESLQLQQSFTESDYTKALDHNKLLQHKVNVLNKRLIDERSNEALIEELRLEARTARAEADNAETSRHAYIKVFSALSDRLSELAGFLQSLMKHKEVLNFLSTDRRRAMRTAVDCSLDLSTSIRETLSTGDQSMIDISNLSRLILDDDEHDTAMPNKTLNTYGDMRAHHSFDVLRSENKALRKILDSRRSCSGAVDYAKDAKDRRSLPPFLLDNASESEAWSEPDRQVSMARIGLEETAAANVSAKEAAKKQTTPTEDSDSESVKASPQQSRTPKLRTQDRIAQLEKLIAQRDDRILMVQFQLVEADNNLKKESLRVITLTDEVEKLRKRNDQLLTDIIEIGSENSPDSSIAPTELAEFHKTIQREIDEAKWDMHRIENERDRKAAEKEMVVMQLKTLKAEMEDVKEKYELQLKLAGEKERQRLDTLKEELEQLMEERLKEQERVHEETLERDCIARSIYEDCKAQLVQLQTQYIKAQHTIEEITDNEDDLRRMFLQTEAEARNLRKQLDENVLQASKFVSDRTKLCNEKLQLEKRITELQQQLIETRTQHTSAKERVAVLESIVQKLHEELIETQAEAAATPSRRLNTSDASPSGYASDEVQKSSTKRENNSSPDLGIHSDTGRGSSELSNLQHAFLKTVSLPQSGSDSAPKVAKDAKPLISKRTQHSSSSDLGIESDTGHISSNMDIKTESPARAETDDSNAENNMSVANVNTRPATATANASVNTSAAAASQSAYKHDCIKVEQENAELRRKLAQTKRAFEETYKKLHLANQRKENIQREIKSQIVKTKNVLKYARLNMAQMDQPNAQPQPQQQQEQQSQKQQHHHHNHQQEQAQKQTQTQTQQRNVTNDGASTSTKPSSPSKTDAPH